jgi:hypothetical protein
MINYEAAEMLLFYIDKLIFKEGFSVNSKTSSENIASEAAKVLRQENASAIQRQLAGSVLSQASTGKQTGSQMEDIASKVLQSEKYSDLTKSLAGSVLSQSNKGR